MSSAFIALPIVVASKYDVADCKDQCSEGQGKTEAYMLCKMNLGFHSINSIYFLKILSAIEQLKQPPLSCKLY